ncbi:metal-dependent transcriptional regulator [Pisciglobus halotolerans]|uniref:Manganese transport regulator n=1 Tax=Pisciglobus halotolerans TaxID=745365 RepID=A0A1I3CN00_9LACT|nr:metal-dependent transcriptional regulator [Pisciglobus halotolerans]SFH75867.1 iron (metal) dependent repressor, DtxR family [Pisciglobus halotolerans]
MTPSKEDYLKTIVELGGETRVINNKELVQALNVSAASVTDMNAKLLKENLITHVPYRGVQVTQKGLRTANQLIRKHRLWEVFLSEKLGYDWNEVHEDADRLEHASSDLLIKRLNEFLGEPTHDPHGGLIPNEDGTTAQTNFLPLVELFPNDSFLLKEVEDQKEFLSYLSSKGIHLGAFYQVKEMDPYEGPITLENEKGEHITLGYQAARNIYVDKVAEKQ